MGDGLAVNNKLKNVTVFNQFCFFLTEQTTQLNISLMHTHTHEMVFLSKPTGLACAPIPTRPGLYLMGTSHAPNTIFFTVAVNAVAGSVFQVSAE